jgi:hypothetical protein
LEWAWSSTSKQVSDATLPDAIQLFVLTTTDHGTSSDHEELWQGWQAGFTTLSTNSIQRVVSGASHSSIMFDEVDAIATVEAILKVIEAYRTGQPLASSPMFPMTTQISQQ